MKNCDIGLENFQDLGHSFSPFQSLNNFWITEYSFTSLNYDSLFVNSIQVVLAN